MSLTVSNLQPYNSMLLVAKRLIQLKAKNIFSIREKKLRDGIRKTRSTAPECCGTSLFFIPSRVFNH